MGDSRDLKRDHPLGVNAFYGTIASVPATLADLVWVVLPDFDPAQRWGPCRWSPRFQIVMQNVAEGAQAAHVGGVAEAAHIVEIAQNLFPKRGDECLVMFDNHRKPWIVDWWPY